MLVSCSSPGSSPEIRPLTLMARTVLAAVARSKPSCLAQIFSASIHFSCQSALSRSLTSGAVSIIHRLRESARSLSTGNAEIPLLRVGSAWLAKPRLASALGLSSYNNRIFHPFHGTGSLLCSCSLAAVRTPRLHVMPGPLLSQY